MNLSELVLSANTGADAIKKAPIVEESTGLRCLRIGDVSQKRDYEEWGYTRTTEADYNRYKLEIDDVIIARTGNTIGANCIIEDEINSVYNNGLIRIKADDTKVIPRYLWYTISSKDCQDFVQSIAFGTSTQPNMKINDLLRYSFDYQDMDIQKKIVDIIDPIDKKIKTNANINRNLSEQLDALYANWFGKYKPYNMGIGGDPNYDLEDGWHVEDIYSIADIIYGAPFASKLFNTEGDGKPIVRIRDLKTQELCTYTTEEHPKGYLLQPGDIVVGMDGEFRPYIWGNDEAWLNQRVCVFNNVRENGKAYVYCTIKPLLHSVEATEVATTVIHIGKKDYDEFRVVLPPEEVLAEFETISKPMFDQIVEGLLENRRLTKLRDSLLPKLMSGELDVSELEIN